MTTESIKEKYVLWFIAQGLIYTAIFAAVVLVVYGRTPEFQYLLEMTVRKLKKKLRGGE